MRSSFPDGWRVEISLPDPEGLKASWRNRARRKATSRCRHPRAGAITISSAPAWSSSTGILARFWPRTWAVGKTIQLIGLLNLRPEIRAALVVCPASVKLVWRREFENWLLPGRRVAIVGEPGFEKADIWVTNYEQLGKYQAQLRARRLDLLVCDESHFIKNPKSIRSKLARASGSSGRAPHSDDRHAGFKQARRIVGAAQSDRSRAMANFFPFATRYCDAHRNQFGWDF